MKNMDIEEVREFVRNSSESSVIYVGADSERHKKNGKWYATYTVVVVVHIDGKRGCKIFGRTDIEIDYDAKKSRPRLRLMNEVYKAVDVYLELIDAIGDRESHIHLDLNMSEKHGSSCVTQEAIGYVRGVCGIEPNVKPTAFAASYAADRFTEIAA